MSTVNADAIKPRDTGLDITLGATGDTTVISADSIDVNTVKDSGGNTLWTSDDSGTLSSVNSAFSGSQKLIFEATASNVANFQIREGLDSTYKVHIVKMYDIYVHQDGAEVEWNVSINGGANYGDNCNKTTSYFEAKHQESDGAAELTYAASRDLANSVNEQYLMANQSNDADSSGSGELWLYNFSGTTYVKHFIYTSQFMADGTKTSVNNFVAGYINTASAIDALFWRTNNGNLSGTFKLYGLVT